MSTDPLEEINADEPAPVEPPVFVPKPPEAPKPMDEGPVLPAGFIWDNSSGRFKKAPVL